MRIDERGIAFDRGAIIFDCLLQIAARFREVAQPQPAHGQMRLELECAAVCGFSRLEASKLSERGTQIQMRCGKLRREMRREFEAITGVFKPPLLEKDQPE